MGNVPMIYSLTDLNQNICTSGEDPRKKVVISQSSSISLFYRPDGKVVDQEEFKELVADLLRRDSRTNVLIEELSENGFETFQSYAGVRIVRGLDGYIDVY